jgi:hypothetical protein
MRSKDDLNSSSSSAAVAYHGSCQCSAISYDFRTQAEIDSASSVFTCECSACTKRAYIFYVVSLKQFKFMSRCASDLGTFASDCGYYRANLT